MTLVESPTTLDTFPLSTQHLQTHHLQAQHLQSHHHDQHPAHTYDTPLANGAATQINGDIGIGAPARTQAHRYLRPMAEGQSVQMNGNISGWDVEVLRMVMGRA